MSVLVLVKASIMSTMQPLRDICQSEEQSSWKGVEKALRRKRQPREERSEPDCITRNAFISSGPTGGQRSL